MPQNAHTCPVSDRTEQNGYAAIPLPVQTEGEDFPVLGTLARATDTEEKSRHHSAPIGRPVGETILVVDDENDVRELAVAVLEAQGYEVLTAFNGQDALRVFREHTRSPIHLVVSDIVMPQMNGKVMAEWLRALDPELKVLFISGYSDEATAIRDSLEPGVQFLPKPYTSSRFRTKVREILDGPSRVAPEEIG